MDKGVGLLVVGLFALILGTALGAMVGYDQGREDAKLVEPTIERELHENYTVFNGRIDDVYVEINCFNATNVWYEFTFYRDDPSFRIEKGNRSYSFMLDFVNVFDNSSGERELIDMEIIFWI